MYSNNLNVFARARVVSCPIILESALNFPIAIPFNIRNDLNYTIKNSQFQQHGQTSGAFQGPFQKQDIIDFACVQFYNFQ